jgi:hypothetical protein
MKSGISSDRAGICVKGDRSIDAALDRVMAG